MCAMGEGEASGRKHRVSCLPARGPDSFPSSTGDGNTSPSQTPHTTQASHSPQAGVCSSRRRSVCIWKCIVFGWGQGEERERHLLWRTSVLLNFEPYEWLRYKNKYNGYASGRREVVPDGGLDFRKERREIERGIRVNKNES